MADEPASTSRRSPLSDAEAASRLPRKVVGVPRGQRRSSRRSSRFGLVGTRCSPGGSRLLGERAAAEAEHAAATGAADAGDAAPSAAAAGKLEAELQALAAEEGPLVGAIEQALGLALAAARPQAAELAGELEQQAVAAVARATRDVEEARKSLEQASTFATEARWCERLGLGDPGSFVSPEAPSRAIPALEEALVWIARDEAERQERLRSPRAEHEQQVEQEAQAGASGAA